MTGSAWWKYSNYRVKHSHTQREESGSAVLDIFNKLKPRYKKKQCTFHTTLPSSTYHSSFKPWQTFVCISHDTDRGSELNVPSLTVQIRLGGRPAPSPELTLASSLSLRHIFVQRITRWARLSPEPRIPPPPAPQNTYMLHVCRHLG